MTPDGNVILAIDGSVVWETDTGGLEATGFKLQRDGNLVVLSSDGVMWSPENLPSGLGRAAAGAHEAATDSAQLVIRDDGNLLVFNSADEDEFWWETGTGGTINQPSLVSIDGRPDESELMAGDEIRSGEYIHNHHKRADGNNAPHALSLTADGNLVIHGAGGNVVWESDTGGHPPSLVAYLGDVGQLVHAVRDCRTWLSFEMLAF